MCTGTTGQTVTVICSTSGFTGGGTATCGINGQFDSLTCNANTCTCPNGTPTIATGSGATICDTATLDCSACKAGYHLSEPAVSGSAQTCVANTCTKTQIPNSDKADKDSISGKFFNLIVF